jgi:shikimate dehydrogenase
LKKTIALKLYGLFGFPALHSLSPRMHTAGFRAIGFSGYYLPFELDPKNFKKLLARKKKLPLAGFKVTVPFKQTVLPYLDRASAGVRTIGACNTVIVKNGKWHGENTDVYGFLKGLELKRFNPKGKDAVLIGAGGAARAVSYGLLSKGVRSLVVLNPAFDFERAEKLVCEFSKLFPDCLFGAAHLNDKNIKALLPGKDLIVNATILGLKKSDPSPVAPNQFPKAKPGALAYELVYGKRTKFLTIAKQKGYKTQNGLAMLLHQGARAFELWTGQRAPVSVMKNALENADKSKN